jgi:hypothetical protein
MGTRLISNEEVGIRAMVPPDPILSFIYVGQGEDCKGGRHINIKMTRDPWCRLSVVVLHTIVKSEREHPHEMSRHHEVGSNE